MPSLIDVLIQNFSTFDDVENLFFDKSRKYGNARSVSRITELVRFNVELLKTKLSSFSLRT